MSKHFLLLLFPALLAAQYAQKAGKYEVTLRLPEGGLSAQEEMQIEFRIVDSTQVDPVMGPTPVIRAKIQATIDMPAMSGMAKVEEIAHPEGIPGEYGLHPSFAHGGEYRLHLAVTPPAGDPFQLDFPLQVADAREGRRPAPKPYRVEISASPKSPKAGEPVALTIAILRESTRERLTQFDRVHEAFLHLIVIRRDLGEFSHQHPTANPDGTFHLTYTFPSAGDYHLFADVAPRNAGSQVLLARLKVSGRSGPRYDVTKAPPPERALTQSAGPLRVTLTEPPGGAAARKTFRLQAAVEPAAGLQPYLGAMGHFILVHQDGESFVHSHPDESSPDAIAQGLIPFIVRFPKPGLYRGWAQFQSSGQVQTASFILEAK